MSKPLSIHVMVAANGVAVLSPTPTPFNTAIVASVPVTDEQNAWIPTEVQTVQLITRFSGLRTRTPQQN